MKGLYRLKQNIAYDLKYNKALLLMILPIAAYLIIFNYVPMAGAVIAFKQYNFSQGIFGSPWCGFNNFRFFFMSGKAWQVTSNTVLYNAAFIITQNVLEICACRWPNTQCGIFPVIRRCLKRFICPPFINPKIEDAILE